MPPVDLQPKNNRKKNGTPIIEFRS